ncbi:MAG: hypothetical protein KDD25_00905 [Bdellovibrionales bacterium]|nr:hypothetical protein [Bdellovibrionales bacterium]
MENLEVNSKASTFSESERNQLTLRLKEALIDAIGAKAIQPNDIGNDEEIFGPESKLQLDSLDALELINIIEVNFDLKVNLQNNSRVIFKSFNTVIDHILSHANAEKIRAFIAN